jgi:protein involved in polysaccharide export with SLBB domain
MSRLSLLLLLGLGLTGVATSPPALHAQPADPVRESEISLQPGDLVRLVIWREEDLSGDFPVNEHGVVTLPLLGERSVVGMPFDELRRNLIREFRTELHNPSIMLTALRRISVVGEVRLPSVYWVDPTVTVATALAVAGGATPLGDPTRIRVIREGRVMHYRGGSEETLATMGVHSGDQIIVEQVSWMQRNSALLFSTGVSIFFFTMSILLR